jgi:hypothetical protein
MQSPPDIGKFRFVILASLRAVQLTRGCLPRIEGVHKHTVMAQLEVMHGQVFQAPALALPDLAGNIAMREDTADEQTTPVLVTS